MAPGLGSSPYAEAAAASTMDTHIRYKVNQALFTSTPHSTVLAFAAHLVNERLLSEDECIEHLPQIKRLFGQWQKGSRAQQSQPTRQSPLSPESPKSPQRLPITSSPTSSVSLPAQHVRQEDLRPEVAVDTLADAIKNLDKSFSSDALQAECYAPDNDRPCPVKMMRSRASKSWIRADTLSRSEIVPEGTTVNLKWSSWRIPGYEDQAIKRFCFHVVDKEAALAAEMTFDMLVGTLDEEVPLEQSRDTQAGTSPSASTNTSPTDEAFPPCRLPALFVRASIEEIGEIWDVFGNRGNGGDEGLMVTGRPDGRLAYSQNLGSHKRKRSSGDGSEGRSRRHNGGSASHR